MLQKGQVLHTLRGHDSSIASLDFSPDGRTLITGDSNAALKVWDVARGVAITHFRNSSRAINDPVQPRRPLLRHRRRR